MYSRQFIPNIIINLILIIWRHHIQSSGGTGEKEINGSI